MVNNTLPDAAEGLNGDERVCDDHLVLTVVRRDGQGCPCQAGRFLVFVRVPDVWIRPVVTHTVLNPGGVAKGYRWGLEMASGGGGNRAGQGGW